MTGSDSRLEGVWAARAAECFRTLQCHQTATDEQLIPVRAILIEE